MRRSTPPTRSRYAPQRRTRPGAAPGTLITDPAAPVPRSSLLEYDAGAVDEVADASLERVEHATETGRVRWLNVDGLGDAELLRRIGTRHALHPLALEDVVNAHQRPKVERYDEHVFVILRLPFAGVDASGEGALTTEQVAICLGSEHVVTFQERSGDVFEPVRARLRRLDSGLRRRDAGYLAYALIDAVVDAYFPVLERYGETLEALETEVLAHPERSHVGRIHDLKRDLLTLRRAVWPMRDALAALVRDDTPLLDEHTRVYLRDCLDHATQLIDVIETYREIASGLVDIHLASVSNRMNEVMKVLTIIATIFIPLTFVAGIYGMNFDPDAGPWSMPELGWRFGYPLALALMAVIALGLLLWFRRLGWLGSGRRG